MKPSLSETGRSRTMPATVTGTVRGAPVATIGQSSVEVMPAEALARTPLENTKLLVEWLERSSGVKAEMRMGIGGPVAAATFLPGADLPKALETVERSLMPAPDLLMAEGITALWHKTKRRSEDAVSLDTMLDVYCLFLSNWPGDTVIAALSETFEWFPDQAELERRMERHAAPRRLFAHRLREAIRKPATPSQDTPPPDPEARIRVQRMVDQFKAKGRASGQESAPETPPETEAEMLARMGSAGPRPERVRQWAGTQ